WETANRVPPKEIVHSEDGIGAFAVSPNAKMVAVIRFGLDSGVKLFDTVKGIPLEKQPAVGGPISDLFFSPDSSRLGIISDSGQMIYWDCIAGKELQPGADFKIRKGE